MERAEQTIQLLESSLRGQGFQTRLDGSIPDRPGFRAMIPVVNGVPVGAELHYIPGGELFDMLQLYITIADELDEQAMRELNQAVHAWNFSIFLGALAVREDLRTLYHRYCLVLPAGLPARECAVMAESVLVSILRYIAPLQEDALALAGGMTFAQLRRHTFS